MREMDWDPRGQLSANFLSPSSNTNSRSRSDLGTLGYSLIVLRLFRKMNRLENALSDFKKALSLDEPKLPAYKRRIAEHEIEKLEGLP